MKSNSKARTVWPTDLVALVSWEGRVYGNEAWPWERFVKEDEGPHPLETAIEQWLSFATGRNTLVHVQGQTLRGLISARPRSGRSVWEVECLLASDVDVCLGLLDRLSKNAAASQVERVFVRMAADSELLPTVQRAGFVSYLRERHWHRTAITPSSRFRIVHPWRKRTGEDAHNLFRLYNAVVPSVIRELEGPTLKEWSAGLERRRRGQDWVFERDGELIGWLRLTPADDTVKIDLLVSAGEEVIVKPLLSHGIGGRDAFSLVPNYATGLASVLSDAGFEQGGEYISLVRRLAKPVEIAEQEPARVQEHYGVPTLLSKQQ